MSVRARPLIFKSIDPDRAKEEEKKIDRKQNWSQSKMNSWIVFTRRARSKWKSFFNGSESNAGFYIFAFGKRPRDWHDTCACRYAHTNSLCNKYTLLFEKTSVEEPPLENIIIIISLRHNICTDTPSPNLIYLLVGTTSRCESPWCGRMAIGYAVSNATITDNVCGWPKVDFKYIFGAESIRKTKSFFFGRRRHATSFKQIVVCASIDELFEVFFFDNGGVAK